MVAVTQTERADIEGGILDWYEFLPQSRRKVIARRRETQRLDSANVTALRMARQMQDDGLVSIITARRGLDIVYIAERVE